MTCKDCIHEKVCYALIKGGLPYDDNKYPAEEFCMEFKSKTDVVETKHGKWLKTNDTNKLRCSQCDIICLIAQYPHGEAKYCPNCGAKMEAAE